jgi:hypothetical protein
MKNIKLHASPHPAEPAAACLEVWDAEGDSQDLVGRRSSNMRRQNLRCPTERHHHPAVGHRRPTAPPAAGQGRPAASPAVPRPAVPRPPSCSSSPPPPQPIAHHLCPTTCN